MSVNTVAALVTAVPLLGLNTEIESVLTPPCAIVEGLNTLVTTTGRLVPGVCPLTTRVPDVAALLPALPVVVTPVLLRNTPSTFAVVLTVKVQVVLAGTVPL